MRGLVAQISHYAVEEEANRNKELKRGNVEENATWVEFLGVGGVMEEVEKEERECEGER